MPNYVPLSDSGDGRLGPSTPPPAPAYPPPPSAPTSPPPWSAPPGGSQQQPWAQASGATPPPPPQQPQWTRTEYTDPNAARAMHAGPRHAARREPVVTPTAEPPSNAAKWTAIGLAIGGVAGCCFWGTLSLVAAIAAVFLLRNLAKGYKAANQPVPNSVKGWIVANWISVAWNAISGIWFLIYMITQ